MSRKNSDFQTLETGQGGYIAYRRRPGRPPTIVFLSGYKSYMGGTKAVFLDSFCAQHGYAYLRFDYFGHGRSSGEFVDGTIGRWYEDALAVVTQLTDDKLVLVGSSMGGWIMSLLARTIPERIAGMVGIASAPDFTERLMWPRFSREQRAKLESGDVLQLPSAYDDQSYPVTMRFIEEGREQLVLDAKIEVDCPVHLLHGMNDPDVPWETSVALANALSTDRVIVTLFKGSEHRLSSDAELEKIAQAVKDVLTEINEK
ncbi:MAG: alpha/beta hydrolase [Gammaproteobacteria bacterium]|nr:alpha/beta hydrolase [Gammaproteobacteria bacterium]